MFKSMRYLTKFFSKGYDPIEAMAEVIRKHKFEDSKSGIVTPIIRSTTFEHDPETLAELFVGEGPENSYIYSRLGNPTNQIANELLAAMEGTEIAITVSSGMAAITCSVLQNCKQKDHIVCSDTVYGGTRAFFEEVLPDVGVTTDFVDPANINEFKKATNSNTKLYYTETLANPTLKLTNIPELAQLAHQQEIKLMVDNTFTPLIATPAQLGADIVIHSLTKFINGASDLVGGVICCTQEFSEELLDLHNGRVMLLGPTLSSRDAYDIYQRIPHLVMRMEEHSQRALLLAKELEKIGTAVIYPGLSSHPQHELFKSMCNNEFGYGGMLAIDFGTQKKAMRFVNELKNSGAGVSAVSLGFHNTLVSCSGSSTSSEISEENQQKMGLSPGLVRMSVGYIGTQEKQLELIKSAVIKVLGVLGSEPESIGYQV